jgi:hypothetical protein
MLKVITRKADMTPLSLEMVAAYADDNACPEREASDNRDSLGLSFGLSVTSGVELVAFQSAPAASRWSASYASLA